MSTPADIFARLQNASEINALVGTGEHLHLECKTWSNNESDNQKNLAKVISGFANADGGVLVVGMKTTTNQDKYTPDVIDAAAPVSNVAGVKSRIEGLAMELAEPAIRGLEITAIPEKDGSTSGFILMLVPATDGPPCRSRKDWKFYMRLNSGTYPMEYFQLEAMFGRSQKPLLGIHWGQLNIAMDGLNFVRRFTFGVENKGRGIAKYPSIQLENVTDITVSPFAAIGLPERPTRSGRLVFGGGADHVIHPGTVLTVATLEQRFSKQSRHDSNPRTYQFNEHTIDVKLAAEGMFTVTTSIPLPYADNYTA
jgi:hypothetical protein